MSVFNKVIAAHQHAKTQAEHAVAAAAAAKTAAEAEFARQFAEQVDQVARPVFERFAADAMAHGFPAAAEHSHDGKANPIYAVRLVPEKGAQLGVNAASEIVYSLKGVTSEQKVEHAWFFDQRPGKKGVKNGAFGIQSINATVLERELGEFLSSALQARAA